MCEVISASAATYAALASAAAAAVGTGLSVRASNMQQSAAADARLSEVKRQGSIMQDQIKLQNQQRDDSLQSRKAFQDQTLSAYTPDKIASDSATQQNPLANALQAAGERAAAPITADATRTTGAVQVQNAGQGVDSSISGSSSYDQALAASLAHASGINRQQATTQAVMQALTQAQITGNRRLQDSADAIQLAGARNQALNRPLAANNLLSNASSNYYAGQQESVLNKGAGTALAGQALTTLGNIGYSTASSGGFAPKGTAQNPYKALPA